MEQACGARVSTPDREIPMPYRFGTQAEYYLRLAQVAYTPADKAQLLSMACAWHQLGQELDLRDEQDREEFESQERIARGSG